MKHLVAPLLLALSAQVSHAHKLRLGLFDRSQIRQDVIEFVQLQINENAPMPDRAQT